MGKIAVLGTGPSINLFGKEEPIKFDLTIGVNDIWKYVKSDVVVCLDRFSAFTPDRLKVINECKPKAFYSQIVMWDKRPDFRKIEFQPGYPDRICNLDINQLPKSYCSPFVACVIAVKYYCADEIHLFGVDLRNHPHLNGPLLEGVKKHFRNLKVSLTQKNCRLIVHGTGILTEL